MKNKFVISGLALATVLTMGAYTITSVKAQGFANGSDDMLTKLCERFGLNQDEVKGFMDEQRAQRQQEMESKFEENLSQAVTDGRITQEQKNTLLAKHQEIQSKMEELKDSDPQENREAIQALHEEMKAWLDSQGIDMQGLGFGPGAGAGQGYRVWEKVWGLKNKKSVV